MSIGLTGALVGGVLTLLSPCSVMLLPSFFAYAFTDPRRLLSRTVVFYLGLIATLVPIGVLAGSLGAFVTAHRQLLVTVPLGVALGRGFARYLEDPADLLFWAMVVVYGGLCLAFLGWRWLDDHAL